MSRSLPPAAALAAVLFDLDGVLIDSSRAWFQTINRGRLQLGYEPVSEAAFARTFGQGVDDDQRDFFPRQSVAEVDALYGELFVDELDAIDVMPGARALLEQVGSVGLRRALVTNTPIALAHRVLAAMGLAPLFEVVCGAGEAADKPAADLVELALRRLALEASAVIYVGDSPSDVGATRAAGVAMVGLGIDADARVETLAELSRYLPRG